MKLIIFQSAVALGLFLVLRTAAGTRNSYQYYAPSRSSCPDGIPYYSQLQEISQTMANASRANIFQRLLPNLLIERVSGTQGNFDVRQFIKQEMGSLGWAVEEDTFDDSTPLGVTRFSNVIATLDPNVATRIVLACHYDSKLMQGSVPFVAATDSAVPCALLMDAARQLNQMATNARNNNLNNFSFQFIFFDGEEAFVRWTSTDSLYGSRHLAQEWANTNYIHNIDLFILLDLIGTSDTQFVNHFPNTRSNFTTLASIERCLRVNGLLASHQTIFNTHGYYGRVEDDHVPFMQRGVPILHLISTPFPSVWHTTRDNLAHLDPDIIDNFSRILRVYMASLIATQ